MQSKRIIGLVLVVALAVQSASCGLILYPERRGQHPGGRIDPAVAILDAAGLIVFIVPGLVAFAVDFATGCIYLPGGRHAAVGAAPLQVVRLPPGSINERGIESAIQAQTGVSVDLKAKGVEARVLPDGANLAIELGQDSGEVPAGT